MQVSQSRSLKPVAGMYCSGVSVSPRYPPPSRLLVINPGRSFVSSNSGAALGTASFRPSPILTSTGHFLRYSSRGNSRNEPKCDEDLSTGCDHAYMLEPPGRTTRRALGSKGGCLRGAPGRHEASDVAHYPGWEPSEAAASSLKVSRYTCSSLSEKHTNRTCSMWGYFSSSAATVLKAMRAAARIG